MTRKQLWGGRFSEPPAQALKAFNDSFSFDRALLAEDVSGIDRLGAGAGRLPES